MTSQQIDSNDKTAIILVAAGVGARFGGAVPKQFLRMEDGVPMWLRALEVLRAAVPDAPCVVVIHPDHEARMRADLPQGVMLVHGGATREHSVWQGLQALAALPQVPQTVLVHDAARPFVSHDLVQRVRARCAQGDALCVVPALAVADTLKMVDGEAVCDALPRERVRRIQTPQSVSFAELYAAMHKAQEEDMLGQFTDEASVMQWAGHKVVCVEGEVMNQKVTVQEDMLQCKNTQRMAPRVGMGYDVHPFEDHSREVPAGQQLIWLGGVGIPYTRRLKGHSDADVVLHALVDALLGAVGAGDIGLHFPPSDPQWKGADSAMFVAEAVRLVEAQGGRIENVDVTYIGEAPKVTPYREAMRARIADLLGIAPQRVNIKATTTEKLGFTGREEGAAAQAVALVMVPSHF